MDVGETLRLIDELRARGATVVEVNGVRAVFGPPPAKPEEVDPEVAAERARPKPPRTMDDRLFGPLGIGARQ